MDDLFGMQWAIYRSESAGQRYAGARGESGFSVWVPDVPGSIHTGKAETARLTVPAPGIRPARSVDRTVNKADTELPKLGRAIFTPAHTMIEV